MGRKNQQTASVVTDPRFENGLTDALGINFASTNMPNLAAMGGSDGQNTISQSSTMYKNLRNYLISNQRQLLSQSYVEIGLIQTVIDIPVDDALKGGIVIKSGQLDEDDITKLHTKMDRMGDLGVAAQAEKWNRLFGGAGIIALTDQDPEEDLDIDAIGEDTPLEFRASDMWELFFEQFGEDDSGDETSLEIELAGYTHYSYYGEQLHKSRVLKLKGKKAPSFVRPRLRGWGFSEVESLIRSINQYLKATDLSFEVLDEFKLDIYLIKGLAATVATPGGTEKVIKRIAMANYQKNFQDAIVLDADDKYESKQLSFTGLAEAMSGIRMQVASDLRIPISKLFGIAATGFSSGEDDIEVYNSMVESTVRSKLKNPLLKMVQLRCQQLFGFIPDDLAIEFKPLRMLSAEQETTIKKSKLDSLLALKTAGELTTLEFRDAVNRGNLLDIQLDTTNDQLLPDDADTLKRPEMAPDGTEEGEDEEEDEENPDNVVQGKFGKKANSRSWSFWNAFKEDEHPRAKDGKFGTGGGSDDPQKDAKSQTGSGSKSGPKMAKGDKRDLGDGYQLEYKRESSSTSGEGGISTSEFILSSPTGERLGDFYLESHEVKGFGKFAVIKDANIDEDHAGKGIGTKVYKELVKVYGTLMSDSETTSDEAAAVWKKLGAVPATDYEEQLESSSEDIYAEDGKPRWIVTSENMKNALEVSITTATTIVPRYVKQKLFLMPSPYHQRQLKKRKKNSIAFDKASYEGDGGDGWIDPRRQPFFDRDKAIDKGKWAAAEERSRLAYGDVKWAFTTWLYKKLGGSF